MPSATSTLSTLGGIIVNTFVDFATMVFTDYWPYMLVATVLAGLIFAVVRVLHLGKRS
jgi:cell shape-determining protein MreD